MEIIRSRYVSIHVANNVVSIDMEDGRRIRIECVEQVDVKMNRLAYEPPEEYRCDTLAGERSKR